MFQRNRGTMIGKTDYAVDNLARSHVEAPAPTDEPVMIKQVNPGGHFIVGPPTQTGFYWWRAIGSRKLATDPQEVVLHDILGLACLVLLPTVHYRPVTDFIREWAGPLPRPPEG